MADDDKLQQLLGFDPLAAASRITGKSYKTDPGTEALGFVMHLAHNERKRAALAAQDDTAMSNSWDDTKRIYADLGFEVVWTRAFRGEYGREEHLVLWRPDGVLASTGSYRGETTNTSQIYYNWRTESDDHWRIAGSGHFHRDSYDRGEKIWIGDNDVREGLRHKLRQLEQQGSFLVPWIETPYISLLTYQDFRNQQGASHEEYTRLRLARLTQLPDRIKTLIGVKE